MDRYKTLAAALEQEVLTEMAGTFFGARKGLEDMIEAFLHQAEELRTQAGKVFARVFFLRRLVLGVEGEASFFAALGLRNDPFAEAQGQSGSRSWRPESLPFALLPSTRYAKALALAYAEVQHACEVYMAGEYEDDPERKGRKRMCLHHRMLERLCVRLNERIDKLNSDMPASGVLQYARNISTVEAPGQGSITNALGAESLDKGLQFEHIDFAALKLWRAPELPKPDACAEGLRAFAAAHYAANAERIRKVLAEV